MGSIRMPSSGIPPDVGKEDVGLRGFILSQIEQQGPIPFSQFMEWCLYHPRYGYYRTKGVKIGASGDYYSSPAVHPIFAVLIGRQLLQMSEILGGERFDVIEMGGGRGFLSEDILNWAEKKDPAFYDRLHYHLFESGPFFLAEERERLRHHEKRGKVFWIDPEAFPGGKDTVQGCFLSNELVDAFPVHRVVMDHGDVKEIYVSDRDGQFVEQWSQPSDPRIPAYFDSMDILLEEGQKAEVNLQALDWMEHVGHSLRKGFVLTIDYGYLAHELYASYRREGTLLCYFQHRTSENPYERLGRQDITSHVNFTSLIRKGEEVGLHFTGLVPQFRFLIGLGILQEMETIGKEMPPMDGLKLRLSLKHLMEPEAGMGEVFKVLIQHKRVDAFDLAGLRELDSIPWPAS
jgi:SAM-dependent MidA family methyltransferase